MNRVDDPQYVSLLKQLVSTGERIKESGGQPTDPAIQKILAAITKRQAALGLKPNANNSGRELRANYNDNHNPSNGEFSSGGGAQAAKTIAKGAVGAAGTYAAHAIGRNVGAAIGFDAGVAKGAREARNLGLNSKSFWGGMVSDMNSLSTGYRGAAKGASIGGAIGLGIGAAATLAWIMHGYAK